MFIYSSVVCTALRTWAYRDFDSTFRALQAYIVYKQHLAASTTICDSLFHSLTMRELKKSDGRTAVSYLALNSFKGWPRRPLDACQHKECIRVDIVIASKSKVKQTWTFVGL